jgi:hypothetical protein
MTVIRKTNNEQHPESNVHGLFSVRNMFFHKTAPSLTPTGWILITEVTGFQICPQP